DPDPEDQGKLSFDYVSGATEGISARMDGTKLLVEASSNTPKGTAASLTVRITDGHTDPVTGTVGVTVTASTRELPTAVPDTFEEVDQGETITVPVLQNDFNPFAGEGELRLISAERESGDGTVKMVGDQVEVTPNGEYVGTMTVRYRIGDITEDPDREVDGKIVLKVQGVPDAPGKPTVSSVQDRKVVLSWSPPANNGAKIDGYTVRSVQGDAYEKQCSSTTCTLDGLTNNVKYLFQVTANNRVGESEPSPSSAEARPDARPDTPAAPTMVFGDKELKIAWKTPSTPGSPVQYYTLELSGGVGAGQKTNITGNSYTWTGLENGAEYTVRIRAHNLAPEPSSWSGNSLGEIPAGPPLAAAAPTTAELEPVPPRAQMQVAWVAPNNNGDAIDGYQVQVLRGGTVVQTIAVAAGKTTQAVPVDTSTTAYTYKVRAQNKAGWGAWSDASAPRRGVIKPDTPSAPVATAHDRSITVTDSYKLTAAQLNGASAQETTYQYNLGGGWSADWDGTTISGVSNGTQYAVRVRAVATVDGKQYISDGSAASNGVTPYGIPPAPSVSSKSNAQSVTFSWSANGNNGAAITTEINIDGNGWKGANNNDSVQVGNGYSQQHSIQVRVNNKAGYSDVVSKSETSGPKPEPPAPRVWVTQGSLDPQQCVNRCANFYVNWQNLDIGTKDVKCYSSAYPGGVSDYSYSVNFNGNGGTEISCHQGRDGVDVWVDILGWGDGVDTEKNFWPRP
ncbi:hypothetical protein M2317_003669, partial [Microbacterium sp. ZKA21]|uniref:fibronectin type III domain-containing protein n=1 Tax=Microbacterium sp. ZKA21 TaxID=3381694 RepID=UPI003D1CBB9C